jgi:hypothetical protein
MSADVPYSFKGDMSLCAEPVKRTCATISDRGERLTRSSLMRSLPI